MSRNSKNDSKGSTLKTIRCHLDASEDVLRKVWEEMTQKNTPLIIKLLKSVSEQSEFEANKENGNITNKEITKLRESITKNSELEKQSGRLRSSADSFVKEVYSSWLTLYQKRKNQKERKEYFLNNILKSDVELVDESNCDLQTIRSKAQEILSQPEKILEQINNDNKKKTKSSSKRSKKNSATQNSDPKQDTDKNIPKTLNGILYEIHRTTQEVVTRCAVSYLLKNYNKVSEVEENIKKLEKRRTEKEIQIRRLEKQIQNNRLPNGRDITGEIYNEAFDNLINQVPKNNEEYKEWIHNISKKTSNLPYPIDYLYGDLTWYKNEKGHIFVYFNGWANYHFQICCNQRQRHFFERFLEDHKAFTKKEKGKEKLSGSLFTLRSIQLLWQQGEGKGEPWKVHKLALHCTYDARLWTAEGTEEVRKEKTDQAQKQVNKAEDNDNKSLDEQEQIKLNKNKSSLARLNNSFTRPSKPAYQGQSNIIVGISFHPVELATVAIIDTNTKKVLVCKTVKQLLGSAFNLLSRRRRQQVHLRKEREKAQKKDSPCNMGESEQGEYVDKLLAKRIVEIAKSYQASCIALPTLKDIREIRTSAIQAKAETKIPGDVKGQKLYVKEYNRQIHNWSYNRLQESITSKSAELKISIEFGIQPHYGTLQEQARDLAFYVYQCRINTISK
ncbi:type V CRISPR-associated protein Cas12k [Nostoc sp.]|uniref:type V CRISPR-associated protein Cas12k n=1 Tax=Nostoc sp. TaxID=1180 RepID=UPI002FF4EF9E